MLQSSAFYVVSGNEAFLLSIKSCSAPLELLRNIFEIKIFFVYVILHLVTD